MGSAVIQRAYGRRRRIIRARLEAGISRCIGCGCTDDMACPGGCYWLRVDVARQVGVCSCCMHALPEFNQELQVAPAGSVGNLLRGNAQDRGVAPGGGGVLLESCLGQPKPCHPDTGSAQPARAAGGGGADASATGNEGVGVLVAGASIQPRPRLSFKTGRVAQSVERRAAVPIESGDPGSGPGRAVAPAAEVDGSSPSPLHHPYPPSPGVAPRGGDSPRLCGAPLEGSGADLRAEVPYWPFPDVQPDLDFVEARRWIQDCLIRGGVR